MINLDNDERNLELTSEFIEKSDKDIDTIKALTEFAVETGNILVLSGGYATEALCGGNISRPHGDIDTHLILTGSKSLEKLFAGIHKLLNNEKTKWKLREKQPDKLEYVEDNENREFFAKRRVEVRMNSPHENNIKYPKKKLINSRGNEIEVCVVDLNEMVIQKIHKFFVLKDGVDTSKDRHSSVSDFFDLRRLLFQEELNSELIRKKAPEEYDYVVSLMAKYKNLA